MSYLRLRVLIIKIIIGALQTARYLKTKKRKGYNTSIRNNFYGFKVQLINSIDGISIAFHFTPVKRVMQKHLEK